MTDQHDVAVPPSALTGIDPAIDFMAFQDPDDINLELVESIG